MKKLILIPFVILSWTVFSQGSTIDFTIQDGKIQTRSELKDLQLPLSILFTRNYKDKSVSISNASGNQVLALNNAKFGDEKLPRDGESGKYIILVNANGTVNSSTEKINSKTFNIHIEDSSFLITLDTTPPNTPTDIAYNPPASAAAAGPQNEAYDAGYMVYDALKLADKNASRQSKIEILNAYQVDIVNSELNPYLQELVDNTKTNAQGGAVAGLLNNLGNTDVTNIAAGLARFLVERSKEELNEAFFSKMKIQLNAYPELKTVFPKTASFLFAIQTYSYASTMQVLKEAFETDIQNLSENLFQIKSLKAGDCNQTAICGDTEKECVKYTDCRARLTKLSGFFESPEGLWMGVGMLTVKEAIQSTNPADLLKTIATSNELSELKTASETGHRYSDYNLVASIELSHLISQSLMSKEADQIWIDPGTLELLFKTKDAFQIYVGLLLAKEQSKKNKGLIEFYKKDSSKISFEAFLINAFKTYTDFETEMQRLIKNTHSVYNTTNHAIKKIEAASQTMKEADPQALYDYYRTFTAALKPMIYSQLIRDITKSDLRNDYERIIQFIEPGIDMAYHITTKKFSAAIYDAMILISALDTIKMGLGKNGKKETYAFKPMTKSFVKYGMLISTVARAESSEEVKNALQASVMPVGGASIKRKSAYSISINTYVGFFGGMARSTVLLDSLSNVTTNSQNAHVEAVKYKTFGLYAPIGISLNRGFKSGWGFTLSGQLADVGSLVNFYLSEGDQAALPSDFKVKLADILAPGIQLGINLPRMPISLFYGMQYVPALNKASQITNATLSPIAWRNQISIVVDIPLWNLKVWDFTR